MTERTHFSHRNRDYPSEQRDYGHLSEFQTSGGGTPPKCSQIVFERFRDFLHQPMFSKTPQNSRYLRSPHRKACLKIPVAKSRHIGATIDNRSEHFHVRAKKQVEAAKVTPVFSHWPRKFVQIPNRVRWVFHCRYKVQILWFPPLSRQKMGVYMVRHTLTQSA